MANETPSEISQEPTDAMSRRSFLKTTLASLTAAAGLGAVAISEEACAPNKPTAEHSTNQESGHLGPEKEYVISGLHHYPDGRIAHVDLPQDEDYDLISAGQDTYRVRWDSKKQTFGRLDDGPVFGHDPVVKHRNGYAGITSTWGTDPDNPYHINAVYHAEQHALKPGAGSDITTFTARVGYAFSEDGGKTWIDQGPVIQGQNTLEPGTQISGAGQPCAVEIEEDGQRKLLVYCIDWNGRTKDQIYLYKTNLDEHGKPGQFQGYTAQGFKDSFASGELQPVIPPPVDAEGFYSALPDVKKTDQGYEAVFESKDGFYKTRSHDGTTWDPAEKIFNRQADGNWYSYPSIVEEDGKKYLAYAKKRPSEDNHHLAMRELK